MRKLVYTVVVTYLTFCCFLGMQFFSWYLLDKRNPWCVLFSVTYDICLILTIRVLNKLGRYSEWLNKGIVIASTIFAAIALEFIQ